MRKDIQNIDGPLGFFGRALWNLGSWASRLLFNRKLNLHFENWSLFDDLEPPFVVVGNHVTNFDPVIIGANQKHVIHWVANDAVFRHPFMRTALRWIKIIPKTKGMSDLDTVRIMHKKVREGAVVGLFPEGQTCWDGRSMKALPATPKLLKLLKVPVVAVTIKRGCLSQPRWSATLRRSRMDLDARVILEADELKKLSVEEITERLDQGIYHDDYLYQKENPLPLNSEKRAEYLELFTYICPKCETQDVLVSKGNDVKCSSCSWEFSIDEYGQFPTDESFPFASLADWGAWQEQWTKERCEAYLNTEKAGQPLMEEKGLTILTGSGLNPLRPLCTGHLKLWADRLEMSCDKGDDLVIPFDEMDALSIFKQQKPEFYHQKTLYRFHFKDPRDSAYKWYRYLDICLNLRAEKKAALPEQDR